MQALKLVVIAFVLAVGCSKSDKPDKPDKADKKAGDNKLAWQPDGMDKLSPACVKALACCEAVVAAKNPSATAGDYNGECSGPAMGTWKDPDCAADAKSRASVFDDKPVPDACK